MSDAPETEPKSAFAQRVGLTRSRISQLIKRGLPLSPDGKSVLVDAALAWMAAELDPGQVAAQRRPPTVHNARSDDDDDDPPDILSLTEAKRIHELVKVDRARLELDKARGRLIDADQARRDAFARGRAERDSWLAWMHRVAPLLAAELQADEHVVFVALQREVDDHLTWLADTPLDALGGSDVSH